ncbi:hypothetical protein V1477_003679 [Vespula maculifrons]|uniref:Uncharacterized protein n=1 Tax=Vespula maculifrons TaxID=7453 RepID=A0ABD2CSR2_VESMC
MGRDIDKKRLHLGELGLAVGGWGEGEGEGDLASGADRRVVVALEDDEYMSCLPQCDLLYRGLPPLCFFGLRSITPSRCTYATANRQNSFAPHLNGKPSSLPITHDRREFPYAITIVKSVGLDINI